MKDKEQILQESLFMDKQTQLALFLSLKEGLDREPTEEELLTACNWAIEVELDNTFLSLIKKGMLKITLEKDEDSKSGKLIPAFQNTELGNAAREADIEKQKKLSDEGADILKDILENKDER